MATRVTPPAWARSSPGMRRSLRSASCSRRLAPEPGCCTEPGRPGACAFPALPVSAAFGMKEKTHKLIRSCHFAKQRMAKHNDQ